MDKRRARITVVLDVDTDKFPGWGFDPKDFADLLAKRATSDLAAWNPSVRTASARLLGDDRKGDK